MAGPIGKLLALLLAASAGASAVFRPAAFSFAGVTNRLITPNGDGRNDTATFRFSNPRDSAGTLRVYDLRGHKVADVSIEVGSTAVTWDPRASGTSGSGVFVYVLTVEGISVTGAVVVVR